jgi:hypothetical protein
LQVHKAKGDEAQTAAEPKTADSLKRRTVMFRADTAKKTVSISERRAQTVVWILFAFMPSGRSYSLSVSSLLLLYWFGELCRTADQTEKLSAEALRRHPRLDRQQSSLIP